MDPPQCVAGSNKVYVRFLRNAYLSALAYSDYLGTSAKDVSVGQRAIKDRAAFNSDRRGRRWANSAED
jgi:hypothetical protein